MKINSAKTAVIERMFKKILNILNLTNLIW